MNALSDVEPRRLGLPADPAAAGQARRWVADQLDGWSGDALDTVQLLVSELVTNAILHTGDRLDVLLVRDADVVRVDVIDYNPARPVVKDYAEDAATGRGLQLVASLARAWGVVDGQDRKAVWFDFADGPAVPRTPDPGEELAGLVDLDDWPDLDDEPVAPTTVEIRMTGVPLELYVRTEQHHDALLRELALLRTSGADGGEARRLVELATALTVSFGASTLDLRLQVDEARRAGQTHADLAVGILADVARAMLDLGTLLDEVDRYCEQADLLTLASPPEVRAFRRWYIEDMRGQLDGLPPQPWQD